MSVPSRFRPALRSVVEELVKGNYSGLAQDGRSGRVGAAGLALAVSQYGRKLTCLPEEAFERADVLAVPGTPNTWAVDLPLWTVEEGRSDLTLSATISETGDGVAVAIDDLHVL